MEMVKKMIIRREAIKPEIPTAPPHLRYSLSFLDQLNRLAQVPMIYFYPATTDVDQTSTRSTNLIRKSLSETLVSFYPLAGKLSDDGLFIHCNDQGALYVEAHIPDYTLHQILANPDLATHLIPAGRQETFGARSYLLTVQVNVFKCGGIAITHMCSHRVIDGSGALFFMQAWANTARTTRAAALLQTNHHLVPTFPGASVFPPDPSLPKDSNLCPWLAYQKKPGKCLTRRFVFDSLALKRLRTKASGSRFEAVVALIWGCAMAASRQSSGQRRKGVLLCTFDLRTRMRPLLSDQAFGNLYWKIPMACNAEDSTELQRLVGVVRGGMSRMDEHVSKLRDSYMEAYEEFCDGFTGDDAESTDYFSCSSVLNRGLYDPDFGWGKPKWVCRGSKESSELNNWIFMVETAAGDGIEVWVTIEAKAMAVLETNQDLLQFASVDPCPA